MKYWLPILAILITISACTSPDKNEQAQLSDLEKLSEMNIYSVKGKVKTYTNKYFTVKKIGERYVPTDSSYSKIIVHYDKSGYKIRTTVYDNDMDFEETHIIKNKVNEAGRLVAAYYINNVPMKYITYYVNNDTIITETTDTTGFIYQTEFLAKNDRNLPSVEHIKVFDDSLTDHFIIEYTYDKDGNVSNETKSNIITNKKNSVDVINLSYDDTGNPTQSLRILNGDTIMCEYTYIYY